jgi:hypothetical protein
VTNVHEEENGNAMSACPQSDADGVPGVAAALAAEFRDAFPLDLVRAEVSVAERELRGQTSSEALAELLHRLVRQRLQERLEPLPHGEGLPLLGP